MTVSMYAHLCILDLNNVHWNNERVQKINWKFKDYGHSVLLTIRPMLQRRKGEHLSANLCWLHFSRKHEFSYPYRSIWCKNNIIMHTNVLDCLFVRQILLFADHFFVCILSKCNLNSENFYFICPSILNTLQWILWTFFKLTKPAFQS